MQSRGVIAGLDIGTTKICTILAEVQSEGPAELIGIGVVPSRGLRRGVIVDIDEASLAIADSVSKAEHMAGVEAGPVFIGFSGGRIESQNSRGVVAVAGEDREISQEDVGRVIDAARVVAIPPDRELIHALPREFIVDGCRGIRHPLGMFGIRLEVEMHIITCSATSVRNAVKAVSNAGLDISGKILQPLAAGEAVLTPDEKEIGAVVIDIGGGTTDIAVFGDGSIRYTSSLPIGGNYITNDLAVALRVPVKRAEEIKKRYCERGGTVDESSGGEIGTLPFDGGDDKFLRQVIGARLSEIFEMVRRNISDFIDRGLMPCGAVLTGGTSNIPGISELASHELGLPARIGIPAGFVGFEDIVKNPSFAASIGVLSCAASWPGEGVRSARKSGFFGDLIRMVRQWWSEFAQ